MRAITILALMAGVALAAPDSRPVDELLADLANPGYQVRRKAVLAVEGRPEPELLDRLLLMAVEDPHPNIRSYCADVLGTFRDDRIFPLLARMATGEKWPGPRDSALVALGRLGKPEAYPILIEGLEDASCRGYAAKGLGLLGDARAFEPVLEVWRANPRDGFLVDMAPRALIALASEKAITLFLDIFPSMERGRSAMVRILREHPTSAVREKMTSLLDAEDRAVRLGAIEVLGKAGDLETVDLLVARLGKLGEESLGLARALAELGDPRAARPIAALLRKEKDGVARATFAGVLADLGNAHAVADLIPLLDDATHTRQPGEISSIWQFPWNVEVGAAALWAIRTLVDGEEPYDRNSLCSFPNPPAVDPHAKDYARIRAWWKPPAEDPASRFD